jgi:hypothetical protein
MRSVRHRPPHVTRKRATAHLAMLLSACTDERLRSFTAADLAKTHNVTPAKAEEMLADARERRAG